MDLANSEFFANSALAVVGATVTAHVASATHPNPNAATATTTTDTNGYWTFAGLSDANTYDIKVVFGTSTKWYKANAKLNIGHLYDDTVPDTNRNILPNGAISGWSKWTRLGAAPITLSTTPTEVADHWLASISGGDSGTGTRADGPSGMNAQYCMSYAYTRVGGQLIVDLALPLRMVFALRGKGVGFSIQAHQSANAKMVATIVDSAGSSSSSANETVGSVVTVSATRTIDAGATSVTLRFRTDAVGTGAFTIKVGNFMLDYGAVAPVFSVDPLDTGLAVSEVDRFVGIQTADDLIATAFADAGFLSEFISWFAKRLTQVAGVADWKDAVSVSLSAKVTRAGDTMTGHLIFAFGVVIRMIEDGGTTRTVLEVNSAEQLLVGNSSLAALRLLAVGDNVLIDNSPVWSDANTSNRVTEPKIADGAVTAGKLGNGQVTNVKLDTGAVTTDKITNLAVTVDKLNTDAVSTSKLQDGSVTSLKIADGTIATGDLADGAVTSLKIADGTIATGDLADDAVTALKIAAGAVGTSELADSAVTLVKIAAGNVGTAALADLNVTTGKLANLAVTTAKIDDQGVTDAKVHANNKDGAAGTASMRTLGTGAAQASAGNHAHDSTYLKLAQGSGTSTITFSSGSIIIGNNATGGPFSNFDGMVILGDLGVSGIKTRIATGHDGKTGVFHALEAPVPYFEDFGHAGGQGIVIVKLPADFANFVRTSDYFISLTPYGDRPVWVYDKARDHFIVQGEGWISFDWRVTARQGDLLDVERLRGRDGIT